MIPGGVETTRFRHGVPTIRTETTLRRGASDQLLLERRFIGASENLRRATSFATDIARRPVMGSGAASRADVVSFRP